ncbi:hypothetical protein [Marinobacter sp. ELB17]|uniref:hypothetical protein n=1 Tax=Marinobacter sp. ELB17 TaxID=270374 RepID=UPI0000F38BFB|nr:hypothetical protein [Marinobacter sp. ELB17]EAZ97003.1 hypothetical protein MELB17_09443 [Marinobacter sp. ELB17]
MNAITDHLDRADVIRVDNGPLLTSYTRWDDGSIEFEWTDGENNPFIENVGPEGVAKAQVTGHVIVMTNENGDAIRVETFNLSPFAITPAIHVDAFARYVADLLHRTPDAQETLIDQLDDLIWSKFGGDEASTINNQGPTHQIMALVNRGDAECAVGVLGSVSHKSAAEVLTTLRSLSINRTAA